MNDSLSFRLVADVKDAQALWQGIVDASVDGWLWHTRSTFDFNFSAGEGQHAEDHSFFIFSNNNPIGVVPLTILHSSANNRLEARYYSGFLPWPCLRAENYTKELEQIAFEELLRRARLAGAGYVKVRLTPPKDRGDEQERVSAVASQGWALSYFESHVVSIDTRTLQEVRERYRRYYKKFASHFILRVLHGSDVTSSVEQTYFELHVKDAGGQFRSRQSYEKQADIVRHEEGFYVEAWHEESSRVAGMLLVSVYKGAAYDNSVAIDPEYASLRVGHILKWTAIEELQRCGISTYELGPRTDTPEASDKERGISHFKEGFARGNIRVVWELEKSFV